MSRISQDVACICILLTWSSARAEEPTRDELLQKIQSLQSRVEQLEAQQRDRVNPLVVDETVENVLRDANRRSQLLMQDGSLTAGYDEGQSRFFIRSDDGNFLLSPGLLFQFRSTTNFRDGAKNGDDDIQNGFEIRRMRFFFNGTAFTPDLVYKFQWETTSSTGGVVLQDAFVRYKFARDWSFQVGQFYDLPFHEQTMLDQFVLTADRSLVNALIGGGQTDRVQGVMLTYDPGEKWRASALFHDGYNTDNTDFADDNGGTAFVGVMPTNFGFSGRVEYLAMGTPKNYEDFTALGTQDNLLVIGGGASFSQGGDNDVLFHAVDVQFENDKGLGLYGALLGMWRDIGPDAAIATGDYYDWGVLVQGSYLLNPKLELFARYDYTRLDDEALVAGTEDNIHEITGGVNYYFRNHNAKFTLDGTWLPNGSPVPVRGLGVLAGDDTQLIVRGQFQLLI